jgi:hypothetical protein
MPTASWFAPSMRQRNSRRGDSNGLHLEINGRMNLPAGVTRSPRLPKASSPKNRSGLSVLEDLSDERFI